MSTRTLKRKKAALDPLEKLNLQNLEIDPRTVPDRPESDARSLRDAKIDLHLAGAPERRSEDHVRHRGAP